jgi:hypothetical protein
VEVPNRSGSTLWSIMQQRIQPGTIILHDDARVYRNLHLADRGGFQHETINHSLHYVDPGNRNLHTNTIERRWGILKGKIRGFIGEKDLDMHLSEFLYREQYLKVQSDQEKRRKGFQFQTFLAHAAQVFPGYNKAEF